MEFMEGAQVPDPKANTPLTDHPFYGPFIQIFLKINNKSNKILKNKWFKDLNNLMNFIYKNDLIRNLIFKVKFILIFI